MGWGASGDQEKLLELLTFEATMQLNVIYL